MSYGHWGCYGCDWIKTPGCDFVARRGVRFTNAYTPNAKSGPSRSCILTGLTSWQLGAAANHFAFFPQDVMTFPEALKENGYTVGMTQTEKPFCDTKKGEHYSFDFTFDISNIAPGTYYFIPDIYSDDGTGRHLSYDHPSCNIAFEIVETDDTKLRWQANYYGHIKLNAIETV